MSALARTALRLAGIEALLNDSVITTLCGARIYDSRIAEFNEAEPVPVILVLTEEMEGEAFSANNGGPPFDDHCELMLEIAMRATVAPDGEDDSTPELGVVETDRELEATLDLIEHRAVEALTIAATPQAQLVRRLVRRVSKQKSQRFVDDDTGVKLAIRQVTLTAELKGQDQASAVELADPVVGAAAAGEHNAGNGTVTLAAPAFDKWVLKGGYTFTFTSASEFTVTDPNGATVGSGIAGAPFGRQLRFLVTAGATPFAAGDSFTLGVTQGPYAALPQPLRAVCNAMPDGSSGAATCTVLASAYGAPAAIALFTGANLTVAPQLPLQRDEAPIEPGQPGGDPVLQFDDTIPSSSV